MPGLDAQTDFLRARRRAALGAMVARLRGEPDDVRLILPYEEVVSALGYVSEHYAGKAVVPLDAIVGLILGAEHVTAARVSGGSVER